MVFLFKKKAPINASILPPFFKGGQGGLRNRFIIPLNPPLGKGDLKEFLGGPGKIIARQFMKHKNGSGASPWPLNST
jgi:hypothetical protein